VSFVAVLPSIYPPWTEACVASMRGPLLWNLDVFDNTQVNRGVSVAWNYGVRRMYDLDADWLVILSAGMRFGQQGGDDFAQALDEAPEGSWAVEAGACPTDPSYGFGWHCIAFHRTTFDRVVVGLIYARAISICVVILLVFVSALGGLACALAWTDASLSLLMQWSVAVPSSWISGSCESLKRTELSGR
jgi:hypothetical protein